jgi:hypothetical protein
MDSLYVLTQSLPSAMIRKIWYYVGIGVKCSILMKRKIHYWTRKERNNRWMETRTLWNIGIYSLSGMFHASNPFALPLLLWCEYRIIMTIVVKQNGIHLANLKAHYEMWNKIFKLNQNTIFNGMFHNNIDLLVH